MTGWAARDNQIGRTKKFILEHIDKIRHWKVVHGPWTEVPTDQKATYFIDPPYQVGGQRYIVCRKTPINYRQLRCFCKSIVPGHVIVCENSKASWLPFKDLCQLTGQRYKTTEVI